jgi:hypothetical protein
MMKAGGYRNRNTKREKLDMATGRQRKKETERQN